MARAAADLDAADLLIAPRRQCHQHAASLFAETSDPLLARLRAHLRAHRRRGRHAARRSGTAAFNTSHPLQRAWRDIHFMSMHSAVNTEKNFAHFGHVEFGLGRPGQSPRLTVSYGARRVLMFINEGHAPRQRPHRRGTQRPEGTGTMQAVGSSLVA